MGSKSIPSKDLFNRMNFLHQASALVKNDVLSCYYGSVMKQIAKKSVLKIDPVVKRNFCKRCSIHLNTETSEIAEENNGKIFTINCLKCRYVKRYPTRNYKLWLEKSESTLETDEINIYKIEEKPKVLITTQSNKSNKTKNENKFKKKNKMRKDKIEEEKIPEIVGKNALEETADISEKHS